MMMMMLLLESEFFLQLADLLLFTAEEATETQAFLLDWLLIAMQGVL